MRRNVTVPVRAVRGPWCPCGPGRRGRAGRRAGREGAQHPGHPGRRHRPVQHQRHQPRHDGLQDAATSIASPRKARCSPNWDGQQSCTAGRAAFITGQSPIRTGLTKVGLPRRPEGMKRKTRPSRRCCARRGTLTGQFGKNHLGDRDEMLPTNHGFDEFFGDLYHLNAEQEPEHPDYPKDPAFKKRFGPRGVIHSFADGRITDTGPLTKKRMETIDEEVNVKALDFMIRAKRPTSRSSCGGTRPGCTSSRT